MVFQGEHLGGFSMGAFKKLFSVSMMGKVKNRRGDLHALYTFPSALKLLSEPGDTGHSIALRNMLCFTIFAANLVLVTRLCGLISFLGNRAMG